MPFSKTHQSAKSSKATTFNTLLEEPTDIASIAVALAFASAQVAAWRARKPLVPALALAVGARWAGLVLHNQVHTPIFQADRLNEGFEVALTLATGMPVELYRVHHGVHHHFVNGDGDWTSPFAYPNAHFPNRPCSLPRYVFTLIPRAIRRAPKTLRAKRDPERSNRFHRSLIVLGVVSGVLATRNPKKFAAAFMTPWLVNMLGSPIANWKHHEGCTYEDRYTVANVNLGALSKSLGFNIGYHSTHHDDPALHWSKLPQRFQDEFADHTPRARVHTGSLERIAMRARFHI